VKIASLKEIDAYIYARVISPLKFRDLEEGEDVSSPLLSKNGEIHFWVSREVVSRGDYGFNYERDLARSRARYLVWMRDSRRRSIIADYEPKHHGIRIFIPSINKFENGTYFAGRLEHSFMINSPFGKVTREYGMVRGQEENNYVRVNNPQGTNTELDEDLPF
jgi:hypothetical protein